MRWVRASLYRVSSYDSLLVTLWVLALFFLIRGSYVSGEQLASSPRRMTVHSTVVSNNPNISNKTISKSTLQISSKFAGNPYLRFILSEVDHKKTETIEKRYQGFVFVRRGGKKVKYPATAITSLSNNKTIIVVNFSLPLRRVSQENNVDKRVVYYRTEFNRGDRKVFVNRVPYFAVPVDGCGTSNVGGIHHAYKHLALKLSRAPANQLRVVEVVTEADSQFVTRKGGANSARVASLAYVNAADSIYRRDLALSFDHKNARTSGYDFGTNDSESIHQSFSTNIPSIESDVHILFSGRNFDGATIGLAWLGGACSKDGLTAGVVQEVNPAVTHIVFAHEVGHLLGAFHDQQITEKPECSKNFIMGTSLGEKPPTQFSSCSKSDIAKFVGFKSECFSLLDRATPTPIIPVGPATPVRPPPSSGLPTENPPTISPIPLSGGLSARISNNKRNINVTLKLSALPGNLCQVTLYRTLTDSEDTVSFNRQILNKRQIFRIPISRKISKSKKSLSQVQIKAEVQCAFNSTAFLGPVEVKNSR